VEALLGDFMFAIWDGRHGTLFSARDQLGAKPFYYAEVRNAIVLSNSLECVRQHPEVSRELNDLAIADCLLFGMNHDGGTTVYRDIRRLPGGHMMTWSVRGMELRRYWSLPIDEPVYFHRRGDYVDRFNELLDQAVADRLRTKRVSVFMSGGLDSTLLAATAKRLLAGRGDAQPVVARTFTHESLFADEELGYCRAAASHLDVPLGVTTLDRCPKWLAPDAPRTPEPLDDPADRTPQLDTYAQMAADSPVAFYGEGPDNALQYEWRRHIDYLSRQRRWARLATDIAYHVASHRRIPLLGTIPRMLRKRWTQDEWSPQFPVTLRSELVRELGLKDRWRSVYTLPPSPHPTRPVAYATLSSPIWQNLFEALDTAYTGALLDVRHPYMDVRLLRYMLSVPAMPWCRRKYLLRTAAAPMLPPAVIRRNKTPLPSVPNEEQARQVGPPPVYPSAELRRYAAVETLDDAASGNSAAKQAGFYLSAVSHWLHTRTSLA
jgi:asparagine synthase (glutamine-hydrolysing)